MTDIHAHYTSDLDLISLYYLIPTKSCLKIGIVIG
jgi:hypothetical protein